MPPSNPEISWFVRNDPEEARRRIVEAFEEARGNLTRAAHYFGCCRETLWKYTRDLRLWPSLNEIRSRYREPHTVHRVL